MDQALNVQPWADEVWQKIVQKVERTSRRIGDSFPYISIDGVYNDSESDWWTNGFWPGLMWLLYRDTGNEHFRQIAESCERKLDEPLQGFYLLHHDIGFMWSPTSVANVKLTGNEDSRRRALTAASHLAGRFNPAGSFIRAWLGEGREGWAIIDCMMNLPILYWASETTGDPRFKNIAILHADMVLREFIRPDGSVYHIVSFNPETGERIEALGGQGYAPESAWARGAAWAVYGLALSYKYTREQRYLDAAKKVAHFFLSHLPEDQLPYYDFRAPIEEGMAKDSSSSLIVACGLLEIADHCSEFEAVTYRRASVRILKALDERYSAWDNPNEEGLIMMGTANFPKRAFVNVPMIYGDYYFAEAIARLRGQQETFW